ncbi:enoyl-CoA hydratase-related protein [Pollutibacter soli]|uniref:enoyl-CoA hydratase-related protein n=1 Tax=Pollutibacter soli TaxID=3034157 RepID=UPI0030133DAE
MSSLLINIEDGVGFIRLNRPAKLNAFDRAMSMELIDAFQTFEKDNAVRCIYLTGEGKGFSAGQDLAEVIDPEGPGMQKILHEHYNPIIKKIRSIELPVVAAVNGVAAGAGANIALACDIVVATSYASFIQAFSKLGLVPDSGGTYFLPRLIGWQKASALTMLGDKVSAEEAEKMGMIYRCIPDDQFVSESVSIAKKLAAMPTRSFALTKKALNLSFSNTLEQQLTLEDQLQQAAANTEDFKEGINAFLEKRTPLFTGR